MGAYPRQPGITAGMGALYRRSAMCRCRMASSQLDMGDALHGRREIRALLDDRRSDQRLIRSR